MSGTTANTPSEPPLVVSASPHLAGPDSTPRIMWTVVVTLLPIIAVACRFFGISALLVIAAATAGAVLPELWFGGKSPGAGGAGAGGAGAGGGEHGTPPARRGAGTLADGSAVITGILLGLTLPPGLPLWMAFVGGVFAIAFGKLVFGGLGQNAFNPALLGRAFLQAAFPVALTTWPAPGGGFWSLRGDNLALPFLGPHLTADMITQATPLGAFKFERATTPLTNLAFGMTGGAIGETATVLIFFCGAYLAIRNYLNWRIPASILGTVLVFSGLLYLLGGAQYPHPLFMLCSGGLMLGAVYMATDMVTSPVTKGGCWIFGFGIGFLVVVIRIWGGLAEGVMYAILLMNALVPFLNRVTQPRLFGTRPARGPR